MIRAYIGMLVAVLMHRDTDPPLVVPGIVNAVHGGFVNVCVFPDNAGPTNLHSVRYDACASDDDGADQCWPAELQIPPPDIAFDPAGNAERTETHDDS